MAKNEILPFGIADGANVLPADEYQKLPARNNGFSAGVARSQELNTVWRQASVIAHVIAQFIAETNNSDVLDDGNVDKLKAGLISALSKNVNNTVPTATKTVAGITKLSSATDSNDETLAATPKAVKIAYDLAKTVSIDEVNKKLDKASVLQTTGNSTDKVLSQKACDDNYAKKSSEEALKVGRLNIESPTGDTVFNLGGTNGSSGAEFAYVRNSKRTQVHDTNTKTTVLFPQKSGELALTSDVDAINNYPVGAPIPWPQATPPNGYFVCDGNNFDKAKYPQLALAYPSGKLPILYGEFIRGLDLGIGVDPGRTVLSNQGDAIRNITGRIGYARHGGTEPPIAGGDGAFRKDSNHNSNIGNGRNDDWGSVMSFNASRVVPTANENRPRNVAFLYIVRAA
ncbi:phage tail protein [Arsenophonus endosymbiont of Crataerina pallida]|uniref:phage tail protein n=1 Tax=Arsenophonus endosymbiont of Crataerina pallida TaxID=3066235 RepID=UPI0030CBD39A